MLASPLHPPFLDIYSLWTSSQGCHTLCMVISFFVLLSICLSSSLVHLRRGLEYLTRDTAQVFIPLIRFRLESFVSSSFLVLLRYSFWILFFISTFLWCQPPRSPSICRFRFLRAFYSCPYLVVPFHQLYVICHFSLQALHIFQCQIPFLWPDCIFCVYYGLQFFLYFLLIVWSHPCKFSDWAFPVIFFCKVCIRLCIFWVCG